MEPDWNHIKETLASMPMRMLRPIGRRWFAGALGGASAKSEYIGEMVTQMTYWWRSYAAEGGQDRVRNVMKDIEAAKLSMAERANGSQ